MTTESTHLMHDYYAGEECDDQLSTGDFILLMAIMAIFALLTIAAVVAIPLALIFDLNGILTLILALITGSWLGFVAVLTLDANPRLLKEVACALALMVIASMFVFAIISGSIDALSRL